jgi:hypothetical protein
LVELLISIERSVFVQATARQSITPAIPQAIVLLIDAAVSYTG